MAIFGGMTPEQFAEKLDALAGMKAKIAVVTKERRDALDGIRESVATASKKPSCGERLTAAMNKTAATKNIGEMKEEEFLSSLPPKTKGYMPGFSKSYDFVYDKEMKKYLGGPWKSQWMLSPEEMYEHMQLHFYPEKRHAGYGDSEPIASKVNAEHKFPTALTDDILRGISYGELLDAVSGNAGDEGLADPKVIQDTFKEILATNMQDARYILTKEMPEILGLAKEHYMESVTDADLSAENV